jgi:hypothetical protein
MNLSRGTIFTLVSLAVLGLATLSFADPVTIPVGLLPGDTYRLVFVTSTTTDASHGDIGYYDAFVNAAANSSPDLAALDTTWTPIVSTTDGNVAFNLVGSFTDPIYDLASDEVANGSAGLWTASLLSEIAIDQNGNFESYMYVWTGTHTDGSADVFPLGAFIPAEGSTGYSNYGWIGISHASPDQENSVYAISGELTVPTIPEPGSLSLMMLGGIALVGKLRNLRTHKCTG